MRNTPTLIRLRILQDPVLYPLTKFARIVSIINPISGSIYLKGANMSVRRSFSPAVRKTDFKSGLLTVVTTVLLISMSACSQTAATSTATIAPTATPTATPAPTLQSGESHRPVKVNGLDRTFLLHIPPGLDSSRPEPVVFALHGFDNKYYFEVTDLQHITEFGTISDQSGFILVYPSGISGV
jgi:hypothetical protein